MDAREELLGRLRKAISAAITAEFEEDLKSDGPTAALLRTPTAVDGRGVTPSAIDAAANAAANALVDIRVLDVLRGNL